MFPQLDPCHILVLHCPHCDFLTLSISRLFEHCLRHNCASECVLYQCGQCGIVATQKVLLEEHFRAWHKDQPLRVRLLSRSILNSGSCKTSPTLNESPSTTSSSHTTLPTRSEIAEKHDQNHVHEVEHVVQECDTSSRCCLFCGYSSSSMQSLTHHYTVVHNVFNVTLDRIPVSIAKEDVCEDEPLCFSVSENMELVTECDEEPSASFPVDETNLESTSTAYSAQSVLGMQCDELKSPSCIAPISLSSLPVECALSPEADEAASRSRTPDYYSGVSSSTLASSSCTESEVLQCSQCEMVFGSRKALSHHSSRAHSTLPADHQCSECRQRFSASEKLQQHMFLQHGRLVELWTCDVCRRVFTHISSMKRHRRLAHSVGKIHKCSVCGMVFSRKDKLLLHRRRHDPTRTVSQRGVFEQPLPSQVPVVSLTTPSPSESHKSTI